MAFSKVVKTRQSTTTGVYVSSIHNGDYIKLQQVDFGKKVPRRTLSISDTNSLDKYKQFTTKVRNISGVHDLYICFSNVSGDIRLDYWMFK